ncbi:transposase [Salinibacter sp.]|uniref:transposase n=1 Tax=Salinibacter sp. TaxID=2065818 RepID=UPI0035D44E46
MARLLAEEILEEEVEALAGERHSRERPFDKHLCRWGSDPGSIRIGEEKVPIDVPRVRDKEAGEEQTLESYQAMKSADTSEELTRAILPGLSQGDYGRVAGQFVDGFNLSRSSVSRQFQQRAQQALEEFESRSLEEENFLALWIDGKRVAGEQGDPLHGGDGGWLQEDARPCAGDDGERPVDQGDAPGSDQARTQL